MAGLQQPGMLAGAMAVASAGVRSTAAAPVNNKHADLGDRNINELIERALDALPWDTMDDGTKIGGLDVGKRQSNDFDTDSFLTNGIDISKLAGDIWNPKPRFVVVNGRPCQIVKLKQTSTGKHGHSKMNMWGKDFLNGEECEQVWNTTDKVEIPFWKTQQVVLKPYELEFYPPSSWKILNMETEKYDIDIPNIVEGGTDILQKIKDEESDRPITITSVMGMNKIEWYKEDGKA